MPISAMKALGRHSRTLKALNDLGNHNKHVSKLIRCINKVYSQANVLLEHWKQSHTQNVYSEIIFNISNSVLFTQSSLLIFSIVNMHLYFIPLEVPFDSFSKEAASVTLVKP